MKCRVSKKRGIPLAIITGLVKSFFLGSFTITTICLDVHIRAVELVVQHSGGRVPVAMKHHRNAIRHNNNSHLIHASYQS